MALEGQVIDGVVVLDNGSCLPNGTRVRVDVVAQRSAEDDDDPELDRLILPDASLPPDHPLAPYDREVELALLRKRVEEMKGGRAGIPLEEARSRLAAEFGSPKEDPE